MNEQNSANQFTYKIETFGCKANLTDSQYLEKRLQRFGGISTDSFDAADVYIVNSCTVTDRADRDAISTLRKNQNNGKIAVLTGCMAEVNPDAIQDTAFAGYDRVILGRNSGKSLLPEAIARTALRRKADSDSAIDRAIVVTGERVAWHKEMDLEAGAALEGGESQRTRAFFKVQDGCNQFCSYCIIPHARGRSRSLDPKSVVKEIRSFQEHGVKEVVLTAIHAADYDFDGLDFTGLVETVLRETNLPRLRLTSLDPAEIDSRLLDLMAAEPRLCSHFHVSMQSASTDVLTAMKRGYDAKRAEDCLNEIREKIPGAFIGMDMIAGFPGESIAHHEETMSLLQRSPWTRLHVFPYSERKLTQGARMVEAGLGVAESEKRRRAAEMRALSDARYAEERSTKIGSMAELLTEAKPFVWNGEVYTQGRTRSYYRIIVPGRVVENRLMRVRILQAGPRDTLVAERI